MKKVKKTKHFQIISLMLACAAVLALIGLTLFRSNNPVISHVEISTDGKITCLLHKGDVATQECAMGLKTDSGKYYALKDPKDRLFTDSAPAGPDGHISVAGTLEPAEKDSLYKTSGTIVVKSVKKN